MRRALLCAVPLGLLCATGAEAHLTRITVEEIKDVAPARPGGTAYRILRGHYDGAIDRSDPHNRIITDLALAPHSRDGRVAYRATFALALPRERTAASGVLFYTVPNRGNGDVAADPDGHVRVVSGWQGDIAPQPGVQTLSVPIARGRDGRPVSGPVLQRFTDVTAGSHSIGITGGIGRPAPRPIPLTLDTRRARLTYQPNDDAGPIPVPSADWAFADCRTRPFPGTPDPTQLCLRKGFDPRLAYTLVYVGKDPLVLGIGFAAVRDLTAFLRHGVADDAGTPNPVAGLVRWTIAAGTSQSGNFLRSLIALGFNAAEDGARVFDGANPDIAARQVPLNIRFGVPGGAANAYEPGSEGTLWWTRYDDRVRGRGTHSLLDRCTATATCPKVVETFGASEFWGLRMSPNLVGTEARADIPLPANVRRYYFPGVTHGGSGGNGFLVRGDPGIPGAPRCTLAWNPNPSAPTRRAILRALVDWVTSDKMPPASRYPRLAAGDLVTPDATAMGWPNISHAPSPTGKINVLPDYDFGPTFDYPDLSGATTRQPPRVRRMIAQRVPRVDADGNETAGIPSVQLLVPLGTYTGWNVLGAGYGAGGGCGFIGGFLPFTRTLAERRAAQDPRPSLEERYGDHADFVARVRAVAAAQVAQGWLLPDDAAATISAAEQSDVLR